MLCNKLIEAISTVLKHAEAHVNALSENRLIQKGGAIYEVGEGSGMRQRLTFG